MKTYGTFGELAQGYLYNRHSNQYKHFLFTLPISELFTEVSLTEGKPLDAFRIKSRLAFQMLLDKFNLSLPHNISLKMNSNIPIEKGYASSTADIVACCKFFFQHFKPDFPPEEIKKEILLILHELEYSDYLLHPGITSFYQREHTVIKKYHTNLGLVILGVDEGYCVNTEKFHAACVENENRAEQYAELFTNLDKALSENNYRQVGHYATKSTLLNNEIFPKKHFKIVSEIALKVNAIGICTAHSGSLLGIMFSKYQPNFLEKIAHAKKFLSHEKINFHYFTVLEKGNFKDEPHF